MAKYLRNVIGGQVKDPSSISAIEYNDPAGSIKVSEVGRRLLPLKYISGSSVAYTTDASTIRVLDNMGECLAVYNSDTSLHALTLGTDNTITALAAGATDVAGHVGIPCPPGEWTYIACGISNWLITDSATLMVFVIEDFTSLKLE